MANYGSWKLDDLLTFVANTHTPSTGAATDADAVPGYAVFEDETTAPIVTGSMALLGSAHTVGFYSERLTLSAANGFEKGKSYNVYIAATVGGIVGTMSHNFQLEAEVDANTVSANVTAGNVTGSVFGNVNGNVVGSVASVTNPVTVGTNNDKTGYSLSSPQNFNLIGNITGTHVGNIFGNLHGSVLGNVTGSILGSVNGSVNSVTNPVGISTGTFLEAMADKVWDEAIAGHLIAGSTGNALNSAGSAGDPWSTALPGSYVAGQAGHTLASRMPTGTVIVSQNNDKTGYSLSNPQTFNLIGNISGSMVGNVQGYVGNVTGSVGSVVAGVTVTTNNDKDGYGLSTGTFLDALADKVWDEPIAGHLGVGSVGSALNSAGSAGDPWTTALPGAYGAGTAGNIVGNKLDANITSRMPSGTVTVGDKTGFSLSSPQNFNLIGNISGTHVGDIQGYVGNVTGSVGSVVNPVTVGTNNDKAGYSLSSPQNFNLNGNITGTITNVLNVINPIVVGNVTGSVLGNVNGSVGSVINPVGISTGTFINAVADQVWDEAIAGHLAAGSTGEKLNSAGSAGDPWTTALPGSYGAGTAGQILASRMPTGTVLVGDKTGFSLSSPQNINIVGNVSGTWVGNIQGNVTGSIGSLSDITSALGNKIADFILRRPYASARTSSDGDAVSFRSLLGAIGKLVNRWNISGTTLTVYQEDDATATAPGGTQTVTGTAGADPITQIDTT